MDCVVRFEFVVTRRVPWEADHDSFKDHVGEVRSDIADYGQVARVRTAPDLAKSRVAVEVTLRDAARTEAETQARNLVGKAIRGAGAYHQGLLPAQEELKLRPELNAWSGLRTPTWTFRKAAISDARATAKSA